MEVNCPEVIEEYNSFMGGVDIADQYKLWTIMGLEEISEVVAPGILVFAWHSYPQCFYNIQG